MKNLNSIKELLTALGWERIPCKNTAMVSFKKLNERLNYYYTTGTVTIQGEGVWGVKPEMYREINTDEEMEKIICERPNKN